jgi:hypothetical protein
MLLGSQEPRIRCVPEYVSSAVAEAIELCELAGLELDPGQQLVLTDMLGERADGRWASFEFGVAEPRQNGKGKILEARELVGAFLLDEKLIIHSAHEQRTSSEHHLRMLQLIEGVPEFEQRILRVSRGKGSEAIELRGGQRILFVTRTSGGGRGLTGDLIVLDEAMIIALQMMGTLVPTMAARSMVGNPQLVYAGSSVDQEIHEHGVVFARLRDRALRRVPRIGYVEWSADVGGWLTAHGLRYDPDLPEIDQVTPELLADPEMWAQANPGMGRRISQEHIGNEYGGALGRREFTVERLGIGDWPNTDESASREISAEVWEACLDPRSKAGNLRAFAVETTPDRRYSAISVASRRTDGKLHVETVEHERGTGWVVARAVELGKKYKAPIILDERGPAASLLAEFKDLGIEPVPLDSHSPRLVTTSSSEFTKAYGVFVDAATNGVLRHLGTPELNSAVAGAATRKIGEATAWSRRDSDVDISPLVAPTLAVWAVSSMKPPKARAISLADALANAS